MLTDEELAEYLRPVQIMGRFITFDTFPRRTKKAWKKHMAGRRLTPKESRRVAATSKSEAVRRVPFMVKVDMSRDTYWVSEA